MSTNIDPLATHIAMVLFHKGMLLASENGPISEVESVTGAVAGIVDDELASRRNSETQRLDWLMQAINNRGKGWMPDFINREFIDDLMARQKITTESQQKLARAAELRRQADELEREATIKA